MSVNIITDEELKQIVDEVLASPIPLGVSVSVAIIDGEMAIPDLTDAINKGFFLDQATIVERYAKKLISPRAITGGCEYTRFNFFMYRVRQFFRKIFD